MELKEYVSSYMNELYHDGVKGMKWGHRKARRLEKRNVRLNRRMESMRRRNALRGVRGIVYGAKMARYMRSGNVKKAEKYREKLHKTAGDIRKDMRTISKGHRLIAKNTARISTLRGEKVERAKSRFEMLLERF